MRRSALRPALLLALALVLLASPAAFASCATDCKCFTSCSQFCTDASGHASTCGAYGICRLACFAAPPPTSQATLVSAPLASILDTSCAALPTAEATHAPAVAR
jgi:hypothetical protein